jgi:hypothetical protein
VPNCKYTLNQWQFGKPIAFVLPLLAVEATCMGGERGTPTISYSVHEHRPVEVGSAIVGPDDGSSDQGT